MAKRNTPPVPPENSTVPSADPLAEARAAAEKMVNPALRLTLPGAPATPHHMPGLAGLYRPDIGTPVGGPGELPLEAAIHAAANPALYVELVDCKHPEKARALNKADIRAAKNGIAQARMDQAERLKSDPDAAPTETDRINAEITAVGV